MNDRFDFTEDGRTFTCSAEARAGARDEMWWWFHVSGDRHRYAPFHAVAGDSQSAVRHRITAYYNDLLARRGLPLPTYPR